MKAINDHFERQLTPEEIAAGEHRNFVGGLWHEIGQLLIQFLKQNGILPSHKLLDIGCGALRCGIPIVEYLDADNYYGVDKNASLIQAGRHELNRERLTSRRPHLLVNDKFEFEHFGVSFDVVVAQSVFTHLDMNLIVRCMVEARKVLKSEGRFFSTIFLAPVSGHLAPIQHQPGGVVTNFDTDPFHYSFGEIEWLADISGLSARLIGDWNHPRSQTMVELFTKAHQ